ncbi:hypothetical protein HanRHA438_Chr17g0828281 [Helianthus annuus]|nr:hypothetical protein HanRHA438_Chr17g0828281 [Helianthus annuus]
MNRIPVKKAMIDQRPLYRSHISRFWINAKYEDAVEEVIDVSKEMNEEAPKEIADKALMSKLKEVLDDESEKSEKAKSVEFGSDSEEDGNFLDRYLSKTDKSVDDDSIMVAYTMVGSDKLYSNTEFPLQNVKFENVEKVFKLVELSVNEIKKNDFFSKLKKSVGSSRPTSSEKIDGVSKSQNKKNQLKNKGIGFEKKMTKQELPKSVLSRWIMDSGASRHMTGSLAYYMMSKQLMEATLDLLVTKVAGLLVRESSQTASYLLTK